MAYLKPPFRAEDMEGLYKKVVKGIYSKLPGHYSVDLNDFLGLMLKVNPKARYSAGELLSLPVVLDRMKGGLNLKESAEDAKSVLLQTIKFPNNLQYLTDKLPRPNYEPIKVANLSNFESFRNLTGNIDGHVGKSEQSLIRNKSAASKANASLIHEASHHEKSQLPALPNTRKKQLGHNSSVADPLIKERINKQHEKVEQQIKRYDEILQKNKNIRQQYNLKKISKLLQPIGGPPLESSIHGSNRRDMIGIYGVKLAHKENPTKSSKNHNNSSIAQDKNRPSKLPALKPMGSIPRTLLAKQSRAI